MELSIIPYKIASVTVVFTRHLKSKLNYHDKSVKLYVLFYIVHILLTRSKIK